MNKRDEKQLAFVSVLEHSFKSHERKMLRYMVDNVETYRVNAQGITPDLQDTSAIFSRVAFAILSANAKFDDSVRALDMVLRNFGKGRPTRKHEMVLYRMVPAKAKYVNLVAANLLTGAYDYRRSSVESWEEYRERLRKEVKGLGRAKASFTACLLYPLSADLACIDTWIQKVFLGNTGFKDLNLTTYLTVEAKIRSYANRFGISTFLAQWLIWDHARGGKVNSHAIFPGAHKDTMVKL